MVSSKELKLAYGLAIILFFVGFLSYAAFSSKPPLQPVRIMFQGVAGKVLFDHQTHLGVSGYGIACIDCHHEMEDDEDATPESCSACHEAESEEEDMPNRMDAFHQQCIGCHQDFEAGPTECAFCHIM